MEINHKGHQVAEKGGQFKMSLRTEPETIWSGKPVKLYFKPLGINHPEEPVPLADLHEKKIHLIIVSKDLSYFSHVHPEFLENGEYLMEHTFPLQGAYLLFQDFWPEGGDPQLGRQEVQVKGGEGPKALSDRVSSTWSGDGYEVKINPGDPPTSTEDPVTISVEVKKDGEQIYNLERYLGALAHVVIINKDTQDYLHVHAMGPFPNGSYLMLQTLFPSNGDYKMFLEFKHQGKVRLAEFVIPVSGIKNSAFIPQKINE